MNVVIDDAIYRLQGHGGISTIWRSITPLLPALLPGYTFDPTQPADIFLPTYYGQAPEGAKSVVMVFDFIHERYPGFHPMIQDAVWKREAIKRADAVIAISRWTADDCQRFTGKPASVAYPATTLERASHAEVQAFKAKYYNVPQYVLISGRRGWYKNFRGYLHGRYLVGEQNFPTLCIGGELFSADPVNPRHATQINLPPDELAAAYTGALCLVYPSLYEGFGLPVLEAYACGCPVICGNGGALAEINEAALVVDVTKPREIAEALVKMSDPGVRIEHILKGYEVVKRFSWQDMAAQVAGVIREVVERELSNVD